MIIILVHGKGWRVVLVIPYNLSVPVNSDKPRKVCIVKVQQGQVISLLPSCQAERGSSKTRWKRASGEGAREGIRYRTSGSAVAGCCKDLVAVSSLRTQAHHLEVMNFIRGFAKRRA